MSEYCGLSVDTSDSDTLLAALKAVKDEYVRQLTNGLYTDDMYSEFLEKLDAAGISDFFALYQTALDNFIA